MPPPPLVSLVLLLPRLRLQWRKPPRLQPRAAVRLTMRLVPLVLRLPNAEPLPHLGPVPQHLRLLRLPPPLRLLPRLLLLRLPFPQLFGRGPVTDLVTVINREKDFAHCRCLDYFGSSRSCSYRNWCHHSSLVVYIRGSRVTSCRCHHSSRTWARYLNPGCSYAIGCSSFRRRL